MAFVSTRAMLVLGVSMAVALHCATAATYIVGGTSGWTVPTGNAQLYSIWSANNTFKVGDSLVFNFAANAHNVLQVSKTNYDSCNATGALQTYTTSPATVNLTASDAQYYICGITGHCSGGQKLAITVSVAPSLSLAIEAPLSSPGREAPTRVITVSPAPLPSPATSPSSSSSPPPPSPTPTTTSPPPTPTTTSPSSSSSPPSPTPTTTPSPSPSAPSPTSSKPSADPVSYIVGGSSGWVVPSGNKLYDNWAANKSFKVGDSLVFNFAANAHNVLQVTKKNYDNCTATSPLQTYTTSPATVNLTEPGPQYYICGFPGHCVAGQKLAITVSGKLSNRKKKWMSSNIEAAIGVSTAIFITSTIIFIYIRINRRKRKLQEEEEDIRGYMDPLDSRPPSVENFLHAGIPSRYSYRQIKRYTNNFAIRLGQGGFGTVFKGELPNVCMVAIKILDKSKHSRIQFMNEVATIGRIHHLHLVRLLGYCFEGSKRALIYEYMVNGSLEKYIHADDQNVLNWKQLYSIAMGTARGIAYLHDDCRNRILHCDIKPHNVLLDANFSPKVADFGLAKLTDRDESHVSLTGARGTPGYVAPEVWSRSNGPVTDKSDVYSYGMLVMEMVGGRKNFDMKATRSSKFYYPEWAFKQVEMGQFQKLREENITDVEDEVIAKKLSMLGLWCIQYNPSQRPSMSRVIQMLEGTVDIAMPPQPFPVNTSVEIEASTESSSLM